MKSTTTAADVQETKEKIQNTMHFYDRQVNAILRKTRQGSRSLVMRCIPTARKPADKFSQTIQPNCPASGDGNFPKIILLKIRDEFSRNYSLAPSTVPTC